MGLVTNSETKLNDQGGLLARNTEKHLYHETKPPVVVYTAEDEAKYRAEGYGDEYIHQEYPKSVIVGKNPDGTAITRNALNADEEKALLAASGFEQPSADTRAFIEANPEVPVIAVPKPGAEENAQ